MPLLDETVESPTDLRCSSPDPLPGSSLPRKRKRELENDGGSTGSKRATKKKRSKASKAHMLDNENLNVNEGINFAIGRLDSRLLADYVAQRTKRFMPDLSVVELEDQYLSGRHFLQICMGRDVVVVSERAFVDTSDWNKPRILSNLPDYLDRYGQKSAKPKNLSIASKKLGSPHTLVVTGAGLRAADATRYVQKCRIWPSADMAQNVACFPNKRFYCCKAIREAH